MAAEILCRVAERNRQIKLHLPGLYRYYGQESRREQRRYAEAGGYENVRGKTERKKPI